MTAIARRKFAQVALKTGARFPIISLRILIPDITSQLLKVLDIRVTSQKPEEFRFHSGVKRELLRCNGWKTVGHVETHLHSEYGAGIPVAACPINPGFYNVSERVQILFHI